MSCPLYRVGAIWADRVGACIGRDRGGYYIGSGPPHCDISAIAANMTKASSVSAIVAHRASCGST